MTLDPTAKLLIILGAVLILTGVMWQLGWIQNLKIGRLPGDIYIEKENMKFYFPITTGIVLSAILSLIAWFFRK